MARPWGGAISIAATELPPICVAKGVDEIALVICLRAEDPPAARSVHVLVDIGREIRPEPYQAVAAVIVFATEVRRKARERAHSATWMRRAP